MHNSSCHDPATIRHRLNIPHALHAVSPDLSALHASRVVALHPDISAALRPTHCPNCGSYYFSGDHAPSMKKKKRKCAASGPYPKAIWRRCHMCGFSSDICAHSPIPGDPTTPKTKEIVRDLSHSHIAESAQTTTPPLPRQHSHAKTLTLKDMLSRDRQREEGLESQKQRKEGHEGLAAFLKQL